MKTLVCKIDGSKERTIQALSEVMRLAHVINLDKKKVLQLRLLSEELLGMANGVLDMEDVSFWMEEENAEYRMCLDAVSFSMEKEVKKRLLGYSSTGENEAYRGVSGKICMVLDWFSECTKTIAPAPTIVGNGLDQEKQDLEWSLQRMRQNLEKGDKEWDELEWSVLARLADDVRVGVRFGRIFIIVYKRFPRNPYTYGGK